MDEIKLFKYQNIWIKWKAVKIGRQKLTEDYLKMVIDFLFEHFSNAYLSKIKEIDFTKTEFSKGMMSLYFLIDSKKASIDFGKEEFIVDGKTLIKVK